VVPLPAPAPEAIHLVAGQGKLGTDLPALLDRVAKVAKPGKPYVEVMELADVPGTYFAIFSSAKAMNLALDRASEFIEDDKMTTDAEHADSMREINGHDLRAPDLRRFWAQLSQQRETDPGFSKLSSDGERRSIQIETEFFKKFVLPTIEKNPNAVILAGAIDGDITATLSHEVRHAQFFVQPRYQEVAEDFWAKSITPQDKANLRISFAPLYDEHNETLMANEFQAYLLQNPTPEGMESLVATYRKPLVEALAAKGLTPINVPQWPEARSTGV
jgi:hypothetical protein